MSQKADKRTEKRKTGDLGEDIACRFLKMKGFNIKNRNYLKKWGEIDIIALKDNIYHFIEVKTIFTTSDFESGRVGDLYRPEDNVHPQKVKRLARTIESYIAEKRVENDWQIDIVALTLKDESKKAHIRFIENVVL